MYFVLFWFTSLELYPLSSSVRNYCSSNKMKFHLPVTRCAAPLILRPILNLRPSLLTAVQVNKRTKKARRFNISALPSYSRKASMYRTPTSKFTEREKIFTLKLKAIVFLSVNKRSCHLRRATFFSKLK